MMKTQILIGHEAKSHLACGKFKSAWHSLYQICSWRTDYQSPEFAIAWYETYAAVAEPLFVIAETTDHKELVGLLALAQELGSHRIFNVGDHQSEYHSWIAQRELANEFIVAALIALRARFPRRSLLFRYLPPNTPMGWLNASELRGLVSTRMFGRPLIRLISDQHIVKTLRKKSNKSRLNRLREAGGGELTFGTIGTESDLAKIIDEVVQHYDLRQGAINGVTPFRDDRFKKDFYLRLMRAGLIHAFLLRAGSLLVSAILSVRSRDYLSVGVFAHSVFLAHHSPGKFGVLFLSRTALQDGYRVIDLTPGGEWKARFANDGDSVVEATVYFDARAANRRKRAEQISALLKRSLGLFRLTPQAVRDIAAELASLRRATPAAVGRRLKRWAWDDREFRVYYFDAKKAAALTTETVMRRDNINDLLCFEETSPWLSRTDFFARAVQQMEKGSHIYTFAKDGRLHHYGWLAERASDSFFTEVNAKFVYRPNSAVLFDYYTHPGARGLGLYQRAIIQMLKDAASIPGTERIYISVLADNRPSRHVIEKVGFAYECSLRRRSRFGRVTSGGEEVADGAQTHR